MFVLAHLLLALALPVAAAGEESVDLELLDLEGRHVDPFEANEKAVTVFLFARTDCPISNRYAPEVRRIHDRFSQEGVRFFMVYPDPDERGESIRSHLAEYGYPMAALRDPEHRLVELTGAEVTPEAAVFVGSDRLVYRGRIDDRYVAFGKSRAEPSQRDLEQAIEATLKGEPVATPRTSAVGCYIADLK
jgi:peroxiredoxin